MKTLKIILAALVVASFTAVHAAAPKHTLEETADQAEQGPAKRQRTDHKSAKAPETPASSAPAGASTADAPDAKASTAVTAAGPKVDEKDPLDFLSLDKINADLKQIKFADGSYFEIEQGSDLAFELNKISGSEKKSVGTTYCSKATTLPKGLKPAEQRKATPKFVINSNGHQIFIFDWIDIQKEYGRFGLGSILALCMVKRVVDCGSSCIITKANNMSGPMCERLGFAKATHDEICDRYGIWNISPFNHYTDNLGELLKTSGHIFYRNAIAKLKTLVS